MPAPPPWAAAEPGAAGAAFLTAPSARLLPSARVRLLGLSAAAIVAGLIVGFGIGPQL